MYGIVLGVFTAINQCWRWLDPQLVEKNEKKKEFGMPDLGQEGQVGFVCSAKQPRRLRAACCERITDAKILLVILKLLRTGFRAAEGIHQKGLAAHGGALRPAGPPQSPEEGENLGRQPSRLGVRVLLCAPLCGSTTAAIVAAGSAARVL